MTIQSALTDFLASLNDGTTAVIVLGLAITAAMLLAEMVASRRFRQ